MGSQDTIVKMPVTGSGSSLNDQTIMMRGVTADTDLGLVIAATGAGADTIGWLKGDHATSTDSVVAGTTWTFREIELIDHLQLTMIEYDQTDDMDVASNSGTTLTITSLEDNIDGAWIYAVSGTGVGELSFLTASAAGSATQKTAMGWDSTTDVIKILPICHKLAKLTSASATVPTRLGTDAGAGSFTIFNFENWFQADNYPLQMLDPTKHDNLTLTGARFFSRIAIRSNAGR